MTALATRYERPLSEMMDALDVTTLPGEIAAVMLAHARIEAQRMVDMPPAKRAGPLRKLRTSAELADRVAYALYEAMKTRG